MCLLHLQLIVIHNNSLVMFIWLDLLKHDKLLSKKAPPSHLREVPEYLVDLTTKEASKILKLTRAAMGIKTSKKRPGFRRGLGRSRDPLKTFSAEVT